MLNNVTLVGRLTHDPEPRVLDEGKKVLTFSLAVRRGFKNYEGSYDTDFIKITCWDGLASSVENYASKGAIVAVKGRLQIRQLELDQERKFNNLEVVAERISYIESAKN